MIELYKSTLDRYSRMVTATFCILFLILMTSMIYKIFNSSSHSLKALYIILSLVVIAIVLLIVSYYPRRIILDERAIIIEKLIGSINLPFSNINSISAISSYPIAMTISSKGFLGYLGRTMDGGKSYVTNAKKAVLIKTKNNEIFIISPEKNDEFIKSVRKNLK